LNARPGALWATDFFSPARFATASVTLSSVLQNLYQR
jgi:hypothetical protein